MIRAILKALALVALLAVGATAQSRKPTLHPATSASRRAKPNARTQGFMLGVHTVAAPGVTLSSEVFDPGYATNFGLGAGVMAGYGFNRNISSFVSFDVAKQGASKAVSGTWGLGHLELGVRAHFPDVSLGWPNTVPYLVGSIGRRALAARVTDPEDGETADVAFHGGMLGLGAGFEHFINRNMSLDAGLHLGFGTFDEFTVDRENIEYGAGRTTSTRLRIGVTWRP